MRAADFRLRAVPRRGGFSLVEIMVVLAIIAIVTTLAGAVAMAVLGSQKSSNTTLTVQKVSDAFSRQWQAVVAQAQKEPMDLTTVLYVNGVQPAPGDPMRQTVLSLAGGDAARARVIWVKLRLKQEFPMSFDEINYPTGLGVVTPIGVVSSRYYKQGIANVTETVPERQSAICLYLALKRGRGGNAFDPDASLSAGELRSHAALGQPPDGTSEIIDAWGNPLLFCRWPTGVNPDLGLSGAQAGFHDPVDPTGLLSTPAWITAQAAPPNPVTYGEVFRLYGHDVQPGQSYNLVPAVASAGRNGRTGVQLATMQDNPDPDRDSDDNIYSNVRLGARGD